MKRSLRGLTGGQQRAASGVLVAALRAEPQWRRAARVFGFFPLAGEPDILAALLPGQQLYLPAVHGELLEFRLCEDLAALEVGPFGTRVPAANQPVATPAANDVVLVPGLAFTSSGARLGRGGGFYDRFLGGLAGAATWGMCFAVQILPEIPIEPHDCKVDRVFRA